MAKLARSKKRIYLFWIYSKQIIPTWTATLKIHNTPGNTPNLLDHSSQVRQCMWNTQCVRLDVGFDVRLSWASMFEGVWASLTYWRTEVTNYLVCYLGPHSCKSNVPNCGFVTLHISDENLTWLGLVVLRSVDLARTAVLAWRRVSLCAWAGSYPLQYASQVL